MEGFPLQNSTGPENIDKIERTFVNPIFSNEGNKVSESRVEVVLSNKRLINENLQESSGAFGTVYAVDVRVSGSEENHPFVLKEFHGAGTDVARKAARASLLSHRLAKQAGLKVWNTYRISEDGESILMSTGNVDDWQVMGGSNRLTAEQQSELLKIEDLGKFLEGYYKEAQKAAEKHISISSDVPFFRVRGNEINFVLGDLDQLTMSDEDEKKILKNNLQNMHSRLTVFLENNFGDIDYDSEEESAGEAERYVQESTRYIAEHFHQSVTRYVETGSE